MIVFYRLVLAPRPELSSSGGNGQERAAGERLRQAEKYLAEGSFRLAADALESEPIGLDAVQARHWRQLQREASLLADLSSEPLEEILQHAFSVPGPEWRAEFPRRFQNRAFVFDTTVKAVSGRLQMTYLFPGPDKVRLDIDDVGVLRKLSLDQSRRVIFGVRLASVRLEPPGPVWVVRFQPGSGVLLTDRSAAIMCCPDLNDADAARILELQAKAVGLGSGL